MDELRHLILVAHVLDHAVGQRTLRRPVARRRVGRGEAMPAGGVDDPAGEGADRLRADVSAGRREEPANLEMFQTVGVG